MPMGRTFAFATPTGLDHLAAIHRNVRVVWQQQRLVELELRRGGFELAPADGANPIYGTPGPPTDVVFATADGTSALGADFAINSLTFAAAAARQAATPSASPPATC